ncbi:DUF805 domain-containing protein [Glycomyces tarimensis]
MHWYLAVLKNYAGFSGRARRKEYWMFVLFHALAVFLLCVIAVAGAVTIAAQTDGSGLSALPVIPVILYYLATVVPTIAVVVRRLHDTGRSGWWYLMVLIPFGIGGIVLLVFTVEEGQPHDNQYGPSPKPVPAHPQYAVPYPQGQQGVY